MECDWSRVDLIVNYRVFSLNLQDRVINLRQVDVIIVEGPLVRDANSATVSSAPTHCTKPLPERMPNLESFIITCKINLNILFLNVVFHLSVNMH